MQVGVAMHLMAPWYLLSLCSVIIQTSYSGSFLPSPTPVPKPSGHCCTLPCRLTLEEEGAQVFSHLSDVTQVLPTCPVGTQLESMMLGQYRLHLKASRFLDGMINCVA